MVLERPGKLTVAEKHDKLVGLTPSGARTRRDPKRSRSVAAPLFCTQKCGVVAKG